MIALLPVRTKEEQQQAQERSEQERAKQVSRDRRIGCIILALALLSYAAAHFYPYLHQK